METLSEQTDANNPQEWPLVINFDLEYFSLTFESPDEVRRWAADEFAFWDGLASSAPNYSGSLVRNRDVVTAVQRASDAPGVIQQLRNIVTQYWPSAGPLGTLLGRIPVPVQRAMVFLETANPSQGVPFQMNADVISAKTYTAIYRTLRNDIGALEKAAQTNVTIERTAAEIISIKSSYELELSRFRSLVEKCDADWKDKIESFVQKQALEAPKAYWQERANQYSLKVRWDRRIWLLAICAVSVAIAAFLWFALEHATADNITVELVRAGQRIVIFGTLLGFAVWWLRQKLRDLRTNDHLASDAAERVTMIQTFAAMRASGLQDANLEPILAALYRPAVGVTVDDGGPVLPLELLLKSMSDALKK